MNPGDAVNTYAQQCADVLDARGTTSGLMDDGTFVTLSGANGANVTLTYPNGSTSVCPNVNGGTGKGGGD